VREQSREPVIELVVGDITREVCDAIVNPAGPGLVDHAVRRAAGPNLLEAFHSETLARFGGKLRPGQAVVTPGFELPARFVVHCRPPVYADGPAQAAGDLAACHAAALGGARERALQSIACPGIGIGVYRYPPSEAARIAVGTVLVELRAHGTPELFRFVLANGALLDTYVTAARALLRTDPARIPCGFAFATKPSIEFELQTRMPAAP